MIPGSITEKIMRDAEEMRAFYRSVGLSAAVIERAIEAKFKPPVPDGRGTWARNKKKRAASPPRK